MHKTNFKRLTKVVPPSKKCVKAKTFSLYHYNLPLLPNVGSCSCLWVSIVITFLNLDVLPLASDIFFLLLVTHIVWPITCFSVFLGKLKTCDTFQLLRGTFSGTQPCLIDVSWYQFFLNCAMTHLLLTDDKKERSLWFLAAQFSFYIIYFLFLKINGMVVFTLWNWINSWKKNLKEKLV